MTKIVLADDHLYIRSGIRLLLQNEGSFEIVGEASNGEELVAAVEQHQPDLVITDIEMPLLNGIEATRIIKQRKPDTGVIALTMYDDEHRLVDMLEAGANGYVLKITNEGELVEAIESAIGGGSYFCRDTSMRLSKMIATSKAKAIEQERVDFSEKELAIIHFICEQYASKEIADRTDLTARTVEKYRNEIMHRVGAKNVVGVVIYAIKHKLFIP